MKFLQRIQKIDLRARLAADGRRLRTWLADDPVAQAIRRPGKTEKTALGLSIGLAAALVAFLAWFDWNLLRGPIGRWASAEYDREIEIQGDLDVRLFSWTPSVSVQGLRIGGPDWATDADTLAVERIEAAARLAPLFTGRLELTRLNLRQPALVLIVDEDGRRSWALNPDEPANEPTRLPVIQSLTIRDGRLSLDERRRGLTLEARIDAREGEDGPTGFRLIGEGALNGSDLSLRVQGGPFVNVRRDRPYGFEAELEGAGSRVFAQGRILRPFDLGQIEAELEVSGQDLADLYLISGITTPNSPPYDLTGRLERDGHRYTVSGIDGRVGASDLKGQVVVDRPDERLRVEADLRSTRLDLDDLAVVLGARATTTGGDTRVRAAGPRRLLPDAPLNVQRMRDMDGRLDFRAESVKANAFEVRQVGIVAALEGGVLDIEPLAFAFDQGTLRGSARIDARQDMPVSAVDLRLAGYPIESIIPARDGQPVVTGRLLGRARLQGPGMSVADFAGNADGSIALVAPQGQMRAAFAELLGINAGSGLLKLLSGDQSNAAIRCGVADFEVRDGIGRARTLVIDTEVVLTQGEGVLNLRDETLDLTLDGESKRPRLLRVWAPIRVSGPLTGPTIGVDTGSVVAQAGLTGLLAAVAAPIAAVLPFVEPGLADDADCGGLIASAR